MTDTAEQTIEQYLAAKVLELQAENEELGVLCEQRYARIITLEHQLDDAIRMRDHSVKA